jgi:hypothetical protein
MAVSGVGVALATAGGVLLYAGLKGESPLVAIREIAGGHPGAVSAVPGNSAAAAAAAAEVYSPSGAAAAASVSAGRGFPQLAAAVQQFQGDRYSQARRWDQGYSDCSSFVGKGFKLTGVTPPGASTTANYLTWSLLRKVDVAQAVAGDLLVNAVHMVVCLDAKTAIGQENPSRNVQVGTFASLMSGTGAYLCLRYTGGP